MSSQFLTTLTQKGCMLTTFLIHFGMSRKLINLYIYFIHIWLICLWWQLNYHNSLFWQFTLIIFTLTFWQIWHGIYYFMNNHNSESNFNQLKHFLYIAFSTSNPQGFHLHQDICFAHLTEKGGPNKMSGHFYSGFH